MPVKHYSAKRDSRRRDIRAQRLARQQERQALANLQRKFDLRAGRVR